MKIDLDNNIYFPGEIIKGYIVLKSGNFFTKGVIIYTIYEEEKINDGNKYNTECHNSTKIYYSSLKYPGLVNYSLSKGIRIPFNINLPSYILPSFEFSINNFNKNNYGYIKNFLQIEIPELKLIKQRFIIFRRPITKINTPLSFKAEKNEKIFGLFNKGSPLLSASFDKNYYYFNEEIIIKIIFNNNNSKFKIKDIKIKLMRNIVFKLKENSDNENIEDISFQDELLCKDINMNEKYDINNINKDIAFEIKIKLQESENIFNKYNVDFLNLGLRDKSNLILFLPSFDSSLFKCEYYINIEGIYDTIFPIKNLYIKMPISVYHNIDERISENNEFNLLRSNIDLNEDQNNNNNDENYEYGLIPKPGFNKNGENIQKENSNNNLNSNLINNNNVNIKKKEVEKEVKTYRNDEEKEWNNITNGQILPKLIDIDDENKK